MIEINKVTDQISSLRQQMKEDGIKATHAKRLAKRVVLLTNISHYLETFPSEEFIKSEIGRISKRIELIHEQFEEWTPSQYFEKEKEKYNAYMKECGVPKLRLQLKALLFIHNS